MGKEGPQPQGTPPVLYKYRSFDTDGFDVSLITQGAVWFSSAKHFNDPFDSSVHLYIDHVPWKTKLRHAMDLLKHDHPHKNLEQRRRIATCALRAREREPDRARRFYESQQRQNEEAFGICCLTPVYNDLLMWAHYSDDHKGFCVGINSPLIEVMQHHLASFDCTLLDLVEVRYTEEMPCFGFYETMLSDDCDSRLIDLVTTKSIHWCYEQEYRLMYWKHPDEILFFGKEVIAEVRFGCRADGEEIERLMKAMENVNMEIPVYKAEKHRTRFALEFERLA